MLGQTAFGIMHGYNATVRTLFSRMPPKSIRRAVQRVLVAE